jgi:hypothetical protein
MTCWPNALVSLGAIAREVMSVPPPGAKGLIRRIDLAG